MFSIRLFRCCISFWQPKRAGNADGINWIVTAFLYVLPLRKLVPLDSTVGQGYSAMYRNSVSWVLKITVQLYFLLPLYLLQRLRISIQLIPLAEWQNSGEASYIPAAHCKIRDPSHEKKCEKITNVNYIYLDNNRNIVPPSTQHST